MKFRPIASTFDTWAWWHIRKTRVQKYVFYVFSD